jgi:hypothetical protein
MSYRYQESQTFGNLDVTITVVEDSTTQNCESTELSKFTELAATLVKVPKSEIREAD